jgi:hypothetical protein
MKYLDSKYKKKVTFLGLGLSSGVVSSVKPWDPS